MMIVWQATFAFKILNIASALNELLQYGHASIKLASLIDVSNFQYFFPIINLDNNILL